MVTLCQDCSYYIDLLKNMSTRGQFFLCLLGKTFKNFLVKNYYADLKIIFAENVCRLLSTKIVQIIIHIDELQNKAPRWLHQFFLRIYWENLKKILNRNYWVDLKVLGHFGLGRFGLDISATDVLASENAEGGRFGHNHKFWVWDVCMYKCVMHFIIF